MAVSYPRQRRRAKSLLSPGHCAPQGSRAGCIQAKISSEDGDLSALVPLQIMLSHLYKIPSEKIGTVVIAVLRKERQKVSLKHNFLVIFAYLIYCALRNMLTFDFSRSDFYPLQSLLPPVPHSTSILPSPEYHENKKIY